MSAMQAPLVCWHQAHFVLHMTRFKFQIICQCIGGAVQAATPITIKLQQGCAECLGLLGAVDPSRVQACCT